MGMFVGVAAGSGMAATTMLCQMLKSGDHIVAMNDLYGGEILGCCRIKFYTLFMFYNLA